MRDNIVELTKTWLDLDKVQKAVTEAGGFDEYAKGIEEGFIKATDETQIFSSKLKEVAETLSLFGQIVIQMFGQDGIVIGAFASFGANVATALDNIISEEKGTSIFDTIFGDDASREEKLAAASEALTNMANIIGSVGALANASSKQRIAGIDKEIAAEKKRDGKSKESLAKITALEKKKEAMERKAFENNKKILIAQTIANTAAGIVRYMSKGNIPMAALMGALGAAQLAIIAGTSYQGGASSAPSGPPAEITVGSRDNRVDVSQRASAGELAYLRGERGIGSTANSFRAIGGAAGLRKGYASGGEILVGEQGPEVIRPTAEGYNVVPNDQLGGKPVNAHFTINAIDAQGVEEVLMGQQGNIISMIRSAANDYGEEFLETVNTDVYGTPKSGGGIDY
jgi:hypothetical protein